MLKVDRRFHQRTHEHGIANSFSQQDRVKLPNTAKAEPASAPTAKGKPRLLLMGQRRYFILSLPLDLS